MRHFSRSGVGFLSGIAGTLVVAGLFLLPSWGKGIEPAIKVETTPINRDAKLGASFAPVVKKAAPSVVNIYSTHIIHIRPMRIPIFADPFFRQIFGNQFPDDGRERTRREQGLGSGVIISPDGYILTANHVVDGADEIEVAIADNKKEFTARVIGTDPPTDVAVLKIDAKDLPAITLGDSDQLEVGDVVLAIGNPYRIGQTVTMGIVSALGRGNFAFGRINQYEDFIQTDAAINPGNSGGALVDAEGRLVGINTAIISSTRGSEGVGLAVPINMARRVMERLIADGKVTRGDLAILLQDITPRLAKAFDLPDQNGVLVSDVFPNTPAEKAGIKSGDVIVGFNGKDITGMHNLQLAVSECAPGSSATVKLLHNGRPETVTVTLAELPGEVAPSGNDQKKPGSGNSMIDALDGVTVADLEPEVRRQLGVSPGVRGALVSELEQASNSADAGLQRGDIIMEINRQPVSNSSDAVKLGRQAKGDQILLKIWRRQGNLAGTCYLSVDNTKIGK
jgi:serine protease Do